MKRVVLILVLLGCLLGLRASAFASPPDPLWIPGVYSAADGDQIVLAVFALGAVAPPPPITRAELLRLVNSSSRPVPALTAAVAARRSPRRLPPDHGPVLACHGPSVTCFTGSSPPLDAADRESTRPATTLDDAISRGSVPRPR